MVQKASAPHVHVSRHTATKNADLNGKLVGRIESDLREACNFSISGITPSILQENQKKSFKGVDFGGDGFILSEDEFELIRSHHPNELSFIWPVLNAQDFSSNVGNSLKRHIINFTDCTLSAAKMAPHCLKIVESRVKPGRDAKKGSEKEHWWLYRRAGGAYSDAVCDLTQVLVCPVVAKFLSFGFLPHRIVFTNALNIFAFDTFLAFGILQSTTHQIWALRFASSLRSDTRYNPTDCFETFPFPPDWESNAALEEAGRTYYEFRAALMIRNDEGLTKTYNRFHDPEERSQEILRLRELHAAMDRAVLDAYGWTDIVTGEWRRNAGSNASLQPLECQFLLDYEEDDADPEPTGNRRQKKKPWRYRWPDDIRDEVLARLLALNAERHQEEVRLGIAPGMKPAKKKVAAKKPAKPKGSKASQRKSDADDGKNPPQPELF